MLDIVCGNGRLNVGFLPARPNRISYVATRNQVIKRRQLYTGCASLRPAVSTITASVASPDQFPLRASLPGTGNPVLWPVCAKRAASPPISRPPAPRYFFTTPLAQYPNKDVRRPPSYRGIPDIPSYSAMSHRSHQRSAQGGEIHRRSP